MMWFLSKPQGGNVRRFVFFLILIIFAVLTPAWSEDRVYSQCAPRKTLQNFARQMAGDVL